MAFAFPAAHGGVRDAGRSTATLGMHFFTNAYGGNMMNYANLFWIWGHPEVYILVLPAFGVFSEVVSTFSRKRLFGYTSLVYATAAIAILSFTVWLHHFFTMGASANVNAFFGIATMIIAVPTGVKVFNWLLTMFRGRIRFHPPMVWTLGFIVTFVIGGMTGMLLAIPPADYLCTTRPFLVAHFHNMLIPGALFGYFAGYMYWFPKVFGFALNETWGMRVVLVLADRLLPGLHAALRPGLHGHAAPAGALRSPRMAALPDCGLRRSMPDPARHDHDGRPDRRQHPATATRPAISGAIRGTAERWNGRRPRHRPSTISPCCPTCANSTRSPT